jgi:hypothetical protein
MSKVQNWASIYGAYTDKDNKTSIHTNISVPGYDLDKLDYLKAALLLGDEYVLREFDRFGNTYAAPAIEKIKQLVKQNPQKAKELLDKMKSQLNAKASKLIHSGQTDKFTSINTKDDRIEFRAPGGDYLSIIADNPQKMIDTINRMVETMDAAVDPSKYKEEYQKKLYDMLTGNTAGRDPETGEIEWNKDVCIGLYDAIADEANDSFPAFMEKAFHSPRKNGEIIKAGRELIGDRAIFITKKRYAINIFDKEGKRKDKDGKLGDVKAMGLDLKRADTPKYVQEFLMNVLKMVQTC